MLTRRFSWILQSEINLPKHLKGWDFINEFSLRSLYDVVNDIVFWFSGCFPCLMEQCWEYVFEGVVLSQVFLIMVLLECDAALGRDHYLNFQLSCKGCDDIMILQCSHDVVFGVYPWKWVEPSGPKLGEMVLLRLFLEFVLNNSACEFVLERAHVFMCLFMCTSACIIVHASMCGF